MSYTPNVYTGTSVDDLAEYVGQELRRISEDAVETPALDLRPIFAPPQRPREGMIVFADGTEWNPGAGKGVYVFQGGTWLKL